MEYIARTSKMPLHAFYNDFKKKMKIYYETLCHRTFDFLLRLSNRCVICIIVVVSVYLYFSNNLA